MNSKQLKKRILVTGANGFVGQEVCRELLRRGFTVRAAVRRVTTETTQYVQNVEWFPTGDLYKIKDWGFLDDVWGIVHLAGRVHKMRDGASGSAEMYRRINTDATEALGNAAAARGVEKLVFVSTIKVNGEVTLANQKYNEMDIPRPTGPYAQSKYEAEQSLQRISEQSQLGVTIVRPPLVYGENVRGNFLSLLNLVYRQIPLPLGAIKNRRSLIGQRNLANFIVKCMEEPRAKGKTFVISDGEDLSTPELMQRIAIMMKKRLYLVPIPLEPLRIMFHVAGKERIFQRLEGSLVVDSSAARQTLDWSPPYSTDDELQRTVNWYLGYRKQ